MATRGLPAWPLRHLGAEDLPPAERLVLEAMRRWRQAQQQGHAVLPALAGLLTTADASTAALPLHRLLRAVEAAVPLRLGPMLAPRPTVHEAMLLHALALAQGGAGHAALAALCPLLPPAQACGALHPLLALAGSLAAVGLRLGRGCGHCPAGRSA